MSPWVAQVGGAGASIGLALLFVATRRDLRVGGLAAWAVGCGILTVYLAPNGHHHVLAAAAAVGLVAAAVGAWIVVRVPWLLAVAVLACVPGRIPVHVGSTQANLLLPLYGVVAVAAIALAWELYGDDVRSRELGPLAWPLALLIGWIGVSFLWTEDVRQGAIELLFFILPFGLLTVSLARLIWSRGWVLTIYLQLAVMGLVIAVIGIVQYETRNIFWNPKVRVDNAYAPSGWFYRVNSVFYDPSIYGRFLVIAILASLVVVLKRRGGSLWEIAAALTIGITWAGLLPSFSQSSFVALLVATTVGACRRLAVAEPRARRRRRGRARARRARLACGAPQAGAEVVAVARHRWPLDARLEGRRGRRASPGDRRRGRWLPARVRAARASSRQGAEGGRVAHDAHHGRGRDRAPRASASRLAGVRGAPARRSAVSARTSTGRPVSRSD